METMQATDTHWLELCEWCRAHGFEQGVSFEGPTTFDWRTVRISIPSVGTTALHVFDSADDWECVWSAHFDENTPFAVVKAAIFAAMQEEGAA